MLGRIDADGTVVKEYSGSGYIYKNSEAFKNKSGVCYIPEYGSENINLDQQHYAYQDLERLVNEWIHSDTDRDLEFHELGLSKEEYLEKIFHDLDWMFPETLLEEYKSLIG